MTSFEQRFVDHVADTRFDDLDDTALHACRVFVLDTLGVGVSGSRLPLAAQLRQAAASWGRAESGGEATVWGALGQGARLPVATAALVNAYQIHNQEFDCVHEDAVVHPMAVILSALFADAEARGCSGRELVLALVLAVDVATVLGMSASAPMRFFRPGTAGCIGAAAGLARLRGFDREQIWQAMSLAYSQTGGTMQAHTEGAPVLPMQAAFNARNAITAVDMVALGLCGPRQFLSGNFGYFSIMESAGNADAAFARLGREWQITRVSHKPFPTGRAAHGALDGLQQLRAARGFSAAEVESIVVEAPPLVRRLVERPASEGMSPNYAKLCLGYVVATFLLRGDVGVQDFDPEALADTECLQLAERIRMAPSDSEDPNALAPQRVLVRLRNGAEYSRHLGAILGHPDRPLERPRQLQKFFRCLDSARYPLAAGAADTIVASVDCLEQLVSVGKLARLLVPEVQAEVAVAVDEVST